ncbi:FKBP-type peptidyl-prolyl cis-trans isomerase [Micrococcales bacterium 31B]|nr:FKBP-type peptidyl-prolyl cis-trans isomerase [Micrococcales bacterium 31B]
MISLLLVGGCTTSDDGSNPLDHVEVNIATDGGNPDLSADWPITVASEDASVAIAGSGPSLAAGQLVSVRAQTYNATTGAVLTPLSQPATMRITNQNFAQALVDQMGAAKSGSYFTYAAPAANGQPAKIVLAQATSVPEPKAPLDTPSADMPTVTFDAKGQAVFDARGLGVGANPQSSVMVAGTGDELSQGSRVGVSYQAWQLSTGSALLAGESQSRAASGVPVTLGADTLGSCVDEALAGQKRGVQMMLLCTPDSTVGVLGSSIGQLNTPNAEIAMYVSTYIPEGGTLAAEGALPAVTFDSAGMPGLGEIPSTAPDAVTVQALTQGTGAAITPGMPIKAKFSGWTWSDGTLFDSTYAKGGVESTYDFTEGVHDVIRCWDDALYGQKLGSTLVIGCPAYTAYGDLGVPGQPQGALVFVVQVEAGA